MVCVAGRVSKTSLELFTTSNEMANTNNENNKAVSLVSASRYALSLSLNVLMTVVNVEIYHFTQLLYHWTTCDRNEL